MTATQACPIARAEASLAAIFAACQAYKARHAQARQAKADARLAQGGLWWRKEGNEIGQPPPPGASEADTKNL
jgi:hypothetical protein